MQKARRDFQLKKYIQKLGEVATHVRVTLVEPRDYSRSHRADWSSRADYYHTAANAINKSIKRWEKQGLLRAVNFNFPRFIRESPDGVHFNESARQSILTRYSTILEWIREESEQ